MPLGVDIVRAADARGPRPTRASPSSTASRSCSTPARSSRSTRSSCSTRPAPWSTAPTSSSRSSSSRASARASSSPTSRSSCSTSARSTSTTSTPCRASAAARTRTSSRDRIIRPGDQAFFDIIHTFIGYKTCYYRTFVVGTANDAQRDAYKRAREWIDASIELMRPGVTTDQVAKVWPKAAGVRVRQRDGVLRPPVRAQRRPVPPRAADHQPAELARAPGRAQGGHGHRPRDVLPGQGRRVAARIEEEVVVTADGPRVITRSRPTSCSSPTRTDASRRRWRSRRSRSWALGRMGSAMAERHGRAGRRRRRSTTGPRTRGRSSPSGVGGSAVVAHARPRPRRGRRRHLDGRRRRGRRRRCIAARMASSPGCGRAPSRRHEHRPAGDTIRSLARRRSRARGAGVLDAPVSGSVSPRPDRAADDHGRRVGRGPRARPAGPRTRWPRASSTSARSAAAPS